SWLPAYGRTTLRSRTTGHMTDHLVLPRALGLIQGRIRGFDQCCRGLVAARDRRGGADTDGDELGCTIVAADLQFLDVAANFLRDVARALERGIGQDDDEFLTAETRRQIGRPR